jgi:hypothetical protein
MNQLKLSYYVLWYWEGNPTLHKERILLPYVIRFMAFRSYFEEEHRLRVFENRVLRRIFGPKRDEVTGEWRKLHNEELNDLYSTPNIVRATKLRRMKLVWHVARMVERTGVYRVLVDKPERKRPLGKPRRRWEDNIKMDLSENGMWGYGMDGADPG